VRELTLGLGISEPWVRWRQGMDYRWVLRLSLRRKSGKENSGKQSSSKQEKGIQACTLRETRKTRRSRNETCGSEARGFFRSHAQSDHRGPVCFARVVSSLGRKERPTVRPHERPSFCRSPGMEARTFGSATEWYDGAGLVVSTRWDGEIDKRVGAGGKSLSGESDDGREGP
jgi:hypothetical protein